MDILNSGNGEVLTEYGEVYGNNPLRRRQSIRFQFENLLRRVTKTAPPIIPVHPECVPESPESPDSNRRNLLEELQYLDELTFFSSPSYKSGGDDRSSGRVSEGSFHKGLTPSVGSNGR